MESMLVNTMQESESMKIFLVVGNTNLLVICKKTNCIVMISLEIL